MAFIGKGTRPKAAALLVAIRKAWEPTPEGGLRSNDFLVTFYEAALIQLLNISGVGISSSEFESCARSAIRNVMKGSECNPEVLENEIAKCVKAQRAERFRKFTVITRGYFQLPPGFTQQFSVGEYSLTLSRSQPSGLDLSSFFLDGFGEVEFSEPFSGSFITINVSARNIVAALDQAAEVISIVLGALNFWVNLGRVSLRVGKAKARALLIPGPFLIGFDAHGKRIENQISYYTTRPEDVSGIDGVELDRIERFSNISELIELSDKQKRKYYEKLFRLYFDYLVEVSVDYKVVRMWTAAEHLTFSPTGGSADQIARRLSVWSAEPELASAVIAVFSHGRNLIVHSGESNFRSEKTIELFRNVLDEFVRISLGKEFKELKLWHAAVTADADSIDLEALGKVIPIILERRKNQKVRVK